MVTRGKSGGDDQAHIEQTPECVTRFHPDNCDTHGA